MYKKNEVFYHPKNIIKRKKLKTKIRKSFIEKQESMNLYYEEESKTTQDHIPRYDVGILGKR